MSPRTAEPTAAGSGLGVAMMLVSVGSAGASEVVAARSGSAYGRAHRVCRGAASRRRVARLEVSVVTASGVGAVTPVSDGVVVGVAIGVPGGVVAPDGAGGPGGPSRAGSTAQVTGVLSVALISRSRREPGPIAAFHAWLRRAPGGPNSSGSGSSVSGTSQATESLVNCFSRYHGRKVCRLPALSCEEELRTSRASGSAEYGASLCRAAAGIVRVKPAVAPGASAALRSWPATSGPTGISSEPAAQAATWSRPTRPSVRSRARTLGAASGVRPSLWIEPVTLTGWFGVATVGAREASRTVTDGAGTGAETTLAGTAALAAGATVAQA